MNNKPNVSTLPFTRNIGRAYGFSIFTALLMAILSIAGLISRTGIYPTSELLKTFVANDVVNLIIGLPILLGSIVLARRGKLIGLLLWPGALFYVVYNYLVYAISMPLTVYFPAYPGLALLSLYTMIRLVIGIDPNAVHQGLKGKAPVRVGGGVLIGFGILFFFRALNLLISKSPNGLPLSHTDFALNLTDAMITPIWVIGGVLLWRRQALGYLCGLGLLFQASTLFIGLILFMALQPILSATPFSPTDALAIFVMGLICFIPFGLYAKGASQVEISI